MGDEALGRVQQLLVAARRLAQPTDALGREARRLLRQSTGLSPEGIALAFRKSLELEPSSAELVRLLRSAPSARRVQILLSGTVFTAAHRAIALGLAASQSVIVRASRREPVFPEFLLRAAPGLFELTSQLSPEPGDRVLAFGTSETLAELRRSLPTGVLLDAHGPGFGVVVVGSGPWSPDDFARIASGIAQDTAVFEQRGCLSPRAVLLEADRATAARLGEALAQAMATLESQVPIGCLSSEEQAEIARFRDTAVYAGSVWIAGSGLVSLSAGSGFSIAPVGRNLQVLAVPDAAAVLEPHAADLTNYAVVGDQALLTRLRRVLPRARRARVGCMQSPPFDGPVDRRGPRNLGRPLARGY